MPANFPTTIWDGDSLNRDSDINTKVAPDWRDWRQVVFEVSAVQDYVLNSDILLNDRYLYIGPTPEASLHYASSVVELNLTESGTNDFRIGDGTNYVQISSTGVMTLVGTAKRKISIHPDFDAVDQLILKIGANVIKKRKKESVPGLDLQREYLYKLREIDNK